MYHLTPFWPARFLLIYTLIVSWRLLCMWWIMFFLLSKFSLCLTFDSLIIRYLSVDIFGYVPVEIYLASWIWMFISFTRAIIISYKLSAPLSVFPSSGTPIIYLLAFMVSHCRSFRVSSLFLFGWCFYDWIISNDLSLSLLILCCLNSFALELF